MNRHSLLPASRPPRWGAGALAATLVLAGCGDEADDGSDAGEAMAVSTGFFPLTHLVEKVGGDHVEVTQVTPPGTDPHHVEMTPKSTGQLQEADLVVYLETMQPALDSAVDAVAGDHSWDVAEAVDLEAGPPEGDAEGEGAEHDHTEGLSLIHI